MPTLEEIPELEITCASVTNGNELPRGFSEQACVKSSLDRPVISTEKLRSKIPSAPAVPRKGQVRGNTWRKQHFRKRTVTFGYLAGGSEV